MNHPANFSSITTCLVPLVSVFVWQNVKNYFIELDNKSIKMELDSSKNTFTFQSVLRNCLGYILFPQINRITPFALTGVLAFLLLSRVKVIQ